MPYQIARGVPRSEGTVVLVNGRTREPKFPIGNKGQARNAMARLNQAKPALPLEMKKHVVRIAKQVLGHSTPKMDAILKR